MSLDTDFNQAPYYDDFDEDKNFHRVLFKPGVAVQARELTQLQTILQNQIERFGDATLREGTIITGCNFAEIQTAGYAKVLDLQTNGQPVVMSAYEEARAVGVTTGIQAKIIATDVGLESQTPDLNTIYFKYLTTGAGEEKVFSTTENIEIRNFDTDELITTLTAAGSIEGGSAVGRTYGVTVGEGVIYQKGNFVRVDEQLTIVSKYTNEPDSIVVGFSTAEQLINSNNDTSLLDNSQGSNNENAPGADRLKLVATLVPRTLAEAAGDEEFFAIQEYDRGRVVRRNRTTQFEGVFSELRERTKDESGNYTVNDFKLRMGEHAAGNTDLVSLFVGSGKAYVEGRKVELLNSFDVDVSKATTFETEDQYSLATNVGNYLLVDEMAGNFDTSTLKEIDLYDAPQNAATGGGVPGAPSGSKIGRAFGRAVLLDEGTPGTAAAKYRVYVLGVEMNSGKQFEQVDSIYYSGTGASDEGAADLVTSSIFESSFRRSIFPLGNEAVKSVPAESTALDFIYRTVNKSLTISTSGVLTITLSGGEWPYGDGALNATQLKDVLVIPTENQGTYVDGIHVDLSGATGVVSGATLTISGLDTPGAATSVIAHYNVKETTTLPSNKELKTVYVKVDADANAGHASGVYGLGLPDVFSIENIWAGSTYDDANPEVSRRFKLRTGQQDGFYGLSSVVRRKSYTITPGVNDKLLIELKVFERDTSGSYGTGLFTVSSYPVDDVTPSATTITTEEIPRYTMLDGTVINLRDVVDMRPQVANTINYETDKAIAIANTDTAFINPNTAIEFGSSDQLLAAPNELLETDYEYYLGRRDIVMISPDGTFAVKEGDPSEIPVPPSEPNRGMVLANLTVPPFPSLPKRDADIADRPEYGISIARRENRRYTMRDIGGIETRVKNLEYYTSLNALEVSAKDLVIPDASGLDRFKNGIFVDAFQDFTIANVKDDDFSAGIEPTNQELTPRFKAYPLDLGVTDGSTGLDILDDVATLENQGDVDFMTQPYATKHRSCVTDFYKYSGATQIEPAYDSSYDTTRAPTVDIGIDLTDVFTDFTDALSEFVPLSRTSSSVRRSSTQSQTNTTRTTTTSTTRRTTTTELEITDTKNTTSKVGDFVTDITFSPFMRSRPIRIRSTGLRPNTIHYFFFDKVNVDEHVAPAKPRSSSNKLSQLLRSGRYGSDVKSDSNGIVEAIFLIPEETFFVGDRSILISDVDTLESIDSASSTATVTYHGFNYSIERQSLTSTTRVPEFGVDTSTTTRTTTNRTTQNIERRVNENRVDGNRDDFNDPIAQTFTISNTMTNDDVVMLSGLDVYFKSKSSTSGVTVMIRETLNGFPAGGIIPFSKINLRPADVNDSDSNSGNQIATRVTFEAPVSLSAGVEYCFVVLPDSNSPDYRIWTAQTGQKDVESGIAVTQDSHDGTMFTSTNNRTWTPYQAENIKFTLYKAQFNDSGTLKLSNRNNEFLSVSNTIGDFTVGEEVGVLRSNTGEVVTVTSGSNVITGTGLDIFQAGDYIAYYANTTVIDVLQVQNAANSTQITTVGTALASNTSADYFKTIRGVITHYNRNEPAEMHLIDSSAADGDYTYTDYNSDVITANNYFAAGETVFGERTQATAYIDSVDDLDVSYIQPNIYRTETTATSTRLSADRLTNDSGVNYAGSGIKMPFNDNTYLTRQKTIIKSRSNELPGGDSFRYSIALTNAVDEDTRDSTPSVDFGISNVTAYGYQINNITDDGTTSEKDAEGGGPATTKYIARTVELADGFDADDMKVYLTAYRPAGTNIKVYGRFQSTFDPRGTDEVEWTELLLKPETDTNSSSSNLFDYREFEYGVSELPAASFAAGEGLYLNTDNNNVGRYIDPNGTVYDRYRTFTLKIVLLAPGHNSVPKVKDIRAIALT